VLELAIALLAVVVVAALLLRFVIDVVTVRDYERGVRFRNGRLVGLLSTGIHVAVRPFSEIQRLDGRPAAVSVARHPILTADGVEIQAGLVARYVIVDPVTAVTGDQSWAEALAGGLRAGLGQAVAVRTVDEVLAARPELGPLIASAIASEVARIGVELLGVDVGDVEVPIELRRAAVAIVAARREAEAALERARGETAALRSLAEAGRLIDQHPSLLRLRAIQLAESGSSHARGGGNDAVPSGAEHPDGEAAEAPENGSAGPASTVGEPAPGGRARSRAAGRPTPGG
jgi:regulator of protease activity HflC (stomatin/prohibitin superfamily)